MTLRAWLVETVKERVQLIKLFFFDSESTSNTAVTSATSTASSDMVLEGGSKDGLSDNDNTLPDEFDDSPLRFPE